MKKNKFKVKKVCIFLLPLLIGFFQCHNDPYMGTPPLVGRVGGQRWESENVLISDYMGFTDSFFMLNNDFQDDPCGNVLTEDESYFISGTLPDFFLLADFDFGFDLSYPGFRVYFHADGIKYPATEALVEFNGITSMTNGTITQISLLFYAKADNDNRVVGQMSVHTCPDIGL